VIEYTEVRIRCDGVDCHECRELQAEDAEEDIVSIHKWIVEDGKHFCSIECRESRIQSIPFVAFADEELDNNPLVGETEPCGKCGTLVVVQCGKDAKTGLPSELLQYIAHCDTSWLVGIKGRKIERNP
jgi:hypothetical protein